jgi:hypothetical protein
VRQNEDLFACFNPLQQDGNHFFNSINIMLELSAAICACHKYVHQIGPTINLTNDGGIIEFQILVAERFGEFERYMQNDTYRPLEKKPPAGGTVIAEDPRFSDFDFKIKRSRNGSFDYRQSIVRYKASVSQYVKMLEGVLWMISQSVFTAILE